VLTTQKKKVGDYGKMGYQRIVGEDGERKPLTTCILEQQKSHLRRKREKGGPDGKSGTKFSSSGGTGIGD